MKKKRFAALALVASLAVSSFASLASAGKGSTVYTDVKDGVFYDEASYFLNYEGIMTGYGGARAGELGSEDVVTRGQVVTTLYRLVGEPDASGQAITFTDVTNTAAYYYKPIQWAVSEGIVKGYDNNTFRPSQGCTRREVAKIVAEFANSYGYNDLDSDEIKNFDLSQYSDVDEAGWAVTSNYSQWMAAHGIMTGTSSTTLSPKEYCFRGQWAIILTRLLTEMEAPSSLVILKNDPTDINCMVHADTFIEPNLDITLKTTLDEYSEYGFKYESSDPSIVAVDADGVMTGVGPAGSSTTIKITSKLSGESKIVTVQVGYGPATLIDYVKDDKEDKTVYLDSKIKWSSTAALISDIETIIDIYGRYNGVEFTFDAVDSEGDATYVAKYDTNTDRVVITQNGEDVTEAFNKDEEKEFSRMSITFGSDYNIAKMLVDLAEIEDIAGKKFDGEFTYRDTVISNIEATDDFYVSCMIDDQQYYFFNIGDNVYAQGEDHVGDVTKYSAVEYWVNEGVISATLVEDPQ